MFGDKEIPARVLRDASEAEDGGAALETALLLGLAAFFAFTMRHMLAQPLLGVFAKAGQVLSQALAG